jgi:hypothetical protein
MNCGWRRRRRHLMASPGLRLRNDPGDGPAVDRTLAAGRVAQRLPSSRRCRPRLCRLARLLRQAAGRRTAGTALRRRAPAASRARFDSRCCWPARWSGSAGGGPIEPAAGPATLLLLLMLVLSALGIWSSDPRLTLVGFPEHHGWPRSGHLLLASGAGQRPGSMLTKAVRAEAGFAWERRRCHCTVVLGALIGARLRRAVLRFVSRLCRQVVADSGRLGGARSHCRS